MYFLTTFGGLALGSDGVPLPPSATQRRRLALLVLLARVGDRGVSREKLLGLLWPDGSAADARHALDQLLYATRRDLGREVIVVEGGQLRLNPSVVRSDCAEFEARLERGEWESAVELHAGPFLDSVYLGEQGELERWVETERQELAAKYFAALEQLARDAAERGDLGSAAGWWRRRAAADPLSARTTLRLMETLSAAGDGAAAIQHARTYAMLVREELGLEPDAEVARLAERLASGDSVPSEQSSRPPALEPVGAAAARPLAGGVEQGARPSEPGVETAGKSVRARRRWSARDRWVGTATLAAMLLVGAAVWSRPVNAPAAARPGIRSIAVLPFEDLTRDKDTEYLGDGMSEELLHALAQIPDLKVVARTSAFAFRGRHADVREIAHALGVEAVLEGSVRREGNRLRVTAQLIDAGTGYHLWSGSFDRRVGDALAIQDQISASIVTTLRPRLAGGSSVVKHPAPRNARAYHLYLRGRYARHQQTRLALQQAVRLFEEAIRADPAYAAAYAGLAEAHQAMGNVGFASQDSSYRVAAVAVERALELDSTLADAYAARGQLRFHRWDWQAAELDFRRALELNPGHAASYAAFAMPLVMQGRFDEGLAMMRKAQELDPLALGTHSRLGWMLTLARRYDEAADQLRALLAMDSTRDAVHARLGIALVHAGKYEEGVAALERAVQLEGEYLRSSIPLLGYAYARAGLREDAERIRQRVAQGLGADSVNPYYAAALMGVLGDHDGAFQLLERTFRVSRGCLIDIGVDPVMDSLRSDPRYAALTEALGMQPSAVPD